jgi:WD repeat-containing protein 48
MTLATLRAHVWKTGGDVMLYYKSNGRRPELDTLLTKMEAETAAGADAVEVSVAASPGPG